MKKIGYVGYGNMGSVLLNSLLEKKCITSGNIYLYNRTKEKLNEIKESYIDINITTSINEVINNVDIFFICTSTYSVKDI